MRRSGMLGCLASTLILGTALLTGSVLSPGQRPATITFTNVDHVTTGEDTNGLVVADFGHLGNLQAAVIDFSGQLEIAIPADDPATGNHAWNSYMLSTGLDQIVTADFNHDGNLDLAIENAQENSIHIMLGNGDASFRAVPDLKLESAPRGMVATDFDGDGFADLAVIECSPAPSCSLKRFKANPNSWAEGQFSVQQTIPLPGNTQPKRPGMITTIDFNKDGLNDVALVADTRLVMVFLGSRNGSSSDPRNGDLSLVTQFAIPFNGISTAIAWGSINNEVPPVPDLVVRAIDACGATCGYTNSAYVFLNDGTAHFRQSARVRLTPSAQGGLIGVTDINGDRKQDVVALGQDPYNPMLEYALGRGGGAFDHTVQVMPLPHSPNAPDVTDQPRGFVFP